MLVLYRYKKSIVDINRVFYLNELVSFNVPVSA